MDEDTKPQEHASMRPGDEAKPLDPILAHLATVWSELEELRDGTLNATEQQYARKASGKMSQAMEALKPMCSGPVEPPPPNADFAGETNVEPPPPNRSVASEPSNKPVPMTRSPGDYNDLVPPV